MLFFAACKSYLSSRPILKALKIWLFSKIEWIFKLLWKLQVCLGWCATTITTVTIFLWFAISRWPEPLPRVVAPSCWWRSTIAPRKTFTSLVSDFFCTDCASDDHSVFVLVFFWKYQKPVLLLDFPIVPALVEELLVATERLADANRFHQALVAVVIIFV